MSGQVRMEVASGFLIFLQRLLVWGSDLRAHYLGPSAVRDTSPQSSDTEV